MGGPPAWGMGELLTTPRRKNVSYYEPLKKRFRIGKGGGQ